MDIKKKLAEAQRRYHDAGRDLDRLDDEEDAAIKAATDPLRERIAELEQSIKAEFRPKFKEAVALRNAAQAEVDRFKVEIATAERSGGVGKRYVQWKHAKHDRYGRGPMKPGRIGVVQVWTSESEYPDNTLRLQRPNHGDLYLRLLNKDGSESKRFEKSWQRWSDWYPEGVDPNAVEGE